MRAKVGEQRGFFQNKLVDLCKNDGLMKMTPLTIVQREPVSPYSLLLWRKVVWLRLKLPENRLAIGPTDIQHQISRH